MYNVWLKETRVQYYVYKDIAQTLACRFEDIAFGDGQDSEKGYATLKNICKQTATCVPFLIYDLNVHA